uniref:Pre-mRNA-splicing factor SYF1 n=1 Tax=Strongyloides stercoralis TaxID=6248 RepID=A0A0K0E011_STRER
MVEAMEISTTKCEINLADEDFSFETELLNNPYNISIWIKYINYKQKRIKDSTSVKQLILLYERAVNIFSYNFKLWYQYICFRKGFLINKCPTSSEWDYLIDVFERCLCFLYKMPRIWIDYCLFCTARGSITHTRKVFDRALQSLPIKQHRLIWPYYVKFIQMHNIPETAIVVFKRYLKIFPENREDLIDYLIRLERMDDAAKELKILIDQNEDISKKGKTNFELWKDLCKIISNNPNKIHSLNVEAIFRQGIQKYSDQVALLWCSLANYYIRMPNFEKARDIFEEALNTVTTVRDFTQIFDAYAKVLEVNASRKVNQLKNTKNFSKQDDLQLEIELFIARFEHLQSRRDLLLNSVLLRQNPNNATEWLNRTKLYEGNDVKIIETFKKAVDIINPKCHTGSLSDIWIAYGEFYIKKKQFKTAIDIFEMGLLPAYHKVDDVVNVWCKYIEFELKYFGYEEAIKLLKRATKKPFKRVDYFDENIPVQERVHLSLKIWSCYADLEEVYGTIESTKKVYNEIIDLKIATPQIIINFASFLEENNFFEESFRVYEKGVELFKWPNVYDVWKTYLHKFYSRYQGKKIERMRDLFNQCVENISPKYAKGIFVLYAKFEEKYGSDKRMEDVFERAVKVVEKEDMRSMFNIYINKVQRSSYTKVREIYEKAIAVLPENDCRIMCLDFIKYELKLSEIDRARAIYLYCAEFTDPQLHKHFYEEWQQFEVNHGNRDTATLMIRKKREIEAKFNSNSSYRHAQMIAAANVIRKKDGIPADAMSAVEAQIQNEAANEIQNTISGKNPVSNDGIMFVRSSDNKQFENSSTENPDEINIDDEEGDND